VDRKRTAWKKSRKFGDVKGGRVAPKLNDGIFRRVHSLAVPGKNDVLPIVCEDNPSRDFFFPLSASEILTELERLPKEHVANITHIWLRRFKKSEYEKSEVPLACFMAGSGVRAIVIYPWPIDLKLSMGRKKPSERVLKMFAPYSEALLETDKGWFLEFTESALKDLYVELLLYHEIGHHIDRYNRRWTRANRRNLEEFADQYAYERTSLRGLTFQQRENPSTGGRSHE